MFGLRSVRKGQQDELDKELSTERAFELAFMTGDRDQPVVAASGGRPALPAQRAFELAFVRRRQAGVAGASS